MFLRPQIFGDIIQAAEGQELGFTGLGGESDPSPENRGPSKSAPSIFSGGAF